jgi:hypothetical protein
MSRRTAYLLLATGLVWWLKVGFMALDEGSDDSIQVAISYFAGLGLLTVGGGSLGWDASRAWRRAVRILVALGAGAAAFLLHQAMDAVGDAIVPGSGWFQEESSIWLTATLALVGALLLALRRPG